MPRPLRFAPAEVDCRRRSDGTVVLESPQPLAPYGRCVGDKLAEWAGRAPERVFLAERSPEGWRRVRYGEALVAVTELAAGLLALGLGPSRPLALLSGNGVDHALLTLAAMHAGIPAAPVSPAYSLVSTDFAKLREVVAQLAPGALFVAERGPFARALAALGPALAARGGELPVLDAAAL